MIIALMMALTDIDKEDYPLILGDPYRGNTQEQMIIFSVYTCDLM